MQRVCGTFMSLPLLSTISKPSFRALMKFKNDAMEMPVISVFLTCAMVAAYKHVDIYYFPQPLRSLHESGNDCMCITLRNNYIFFAAIKSQLLRTGFGDIN